MKLILGFGSLVAGLLLAAGCGGSDQFSGVPYPHGAWSASAQGTFIGACGGNNSYCRCALKIVMTSMPDEHHQAASLLDEGMTAAKMRHKPTFAACD